MARRSLRASNPRPLSPPPGVRSPPLQELLDCERENSGCDGGDTARALAYAKENGLHTDAAYPYTGDNTDSTLPRH
jgi:hypothetical protein